MFFFQRRRRPRASRDPFALVVDVDRKRRWRRHRHLCVKARGKGESSARAYSEWEPHLFGRARSLRLTPEEAYASVDVTAAAVVVVPRAADARYDDRLGRDDRDVAPGEQHSIPALIVVVVVPMRGRMPAARATRDAFVVRYAP